MTRFVEGTDRGQSTLFPAVLDDNVGADNPVFCSAGGGLWPMTSLTVMQQYTRSWGHS
jgi:hypothetical protein